MSQSLAVESDDAVRERERERERERKKQQQFFLKKNNQTKG
jgi:hypothetical protein